MQGYRTIIVLILQFAFALGLISEQDSDTVLKAADAIFAASVTLIGIYYKLEANQREKLLKGE